MAAFFRSVAASSKTNFGTFLKFAKAELTPPGPTDIPVAIGGIKDLVVKAKNGSWKHLTVKEAVVNVLVFTEVTCWFWIGEVIGKRNLVGYKVEV